MTDLYPEQRAALAYAERRGTNAPVASIARRLRETIGEAGALLDGVPAAIADVPPAAGGWSVAGVVDHLVVTHELAVEELQGLVAGREPSGPPIPAGLRSAGAGAPDWRDLLSRFREVHADLLSVVESGTDSVPLEPRASVVMVVKCVTDDGTRVPVHWIQSFDWKAYATIFRMHLVEHLAQIRRILREIGSEGAARGREERPR